MNLEDQVVSLEYAKKLKYLGVKQESLFYWNIGRLWYNLDSCGKIKFSAFTSAELGDILPIHVITKQGEPFNSYRLFITTALLQNKDNPDVFDKHYLVNYECDTFSPDDFFKRYLRKNCTDANLANAMSEMVIFLRTNNLMELPE